MSESENDSGGRASRPGNREIAHRLFAAEYDDATYAYSESDEERAPNYVVTPTGARVNRLFVVGVLTEVGQAGDSMLRARVADPTGAFVVYAGQYQPDAMAFLDNAEPPAFVAVTGKARTFQPEDSERVFTSIRPENINEVDSETRDRWVVTTAERTLERVDTIATALDTGYSGEDLRDTLHESGVDPSFAAGIPIALEQYSTTRAYLADVQRLALDTTRLVAGETDIVDDLALAPGDRNGTGSVEPASTPQTAEDETTEIQEQSTTTPSDEATAQHQETESETEPATASAEEITTEQTEPTQAESVKEELDDFDPEDEELDDFDPEEFELDEEVRQEVESEYGTEFSTAAEVDSSGETPTKTDDSTEETSKEAETVSEPSFDDMTDASEEASPQATFESEMAASEQEEDTAIGDTSTETETDTESDAETETAGEDVDLETALLETMHELNDGDGADRETLVERVTESAGVSDDVVDNAIQEALMSGQCYEPNEDKLKPI